MAPNTASRLERGERVKNILSFAKEVNDILSSARDPKLSESLRIQIEKQLDEFPNKLGSAAIQRYEELDNAGTRLWNSSRRVSDLAHDNPSSSDLLLSRVYAFLVLDCGHGDPHRSVMSTVRLMKLSLKTIRSCLEFKRYDLALRVLERSAVCEEYLTKQINQSPGDKKMHVQLTAEGFILRTTLEWRRDQLPVAEHMYQKAILNKQDLDPNTVESLADVLFEMGYEQLKKDQHELAAKWLERAYTVLMSQELEKLSPDASELRTSIINASVKALLGLRRQDAAEKASQLIGLLESEIGDKLVVLLLRLEYLDSPTNDVFDSELYATTLHRLVRTVVLTEKTFDLILYHSRKLHDKSPSLACKILDELLRVRLLQEEKGQWIEKVLINRIWMSTSQKDGPDVLSSIQGVLDSIGRNTISASATHAAQILLWKRIEANYNLGQYEAAASWCKLAMHRTFENSGDMNRLKVSRKMLLCSLACCEYETAQEIFSAMTDAAKNDPLTRFLMYKIAIRGQEVELARECLDLIYQSSSRDSSLLYACILDAQQVGNAELALASLLLVLRKHEYNAPPTVNMTALLRATIRLTTTRLEVAGNSKDSSGEKKLIEQLCMLFEGASVHAHKSRQLSNTGDNLFDIRELDWFSKTSYNITLSYCVEWHPGQALRVVTSCISFIKLYPQDVGEQMAADLKLRHIFCDYLAATLLIALARVEDNIELLLQHYTKARKHIESYDTNSQEKLQELGDGPASEDLLAKLSVLIAYDFEAAVHMKSWDDLVNVITRSAICGSMRVYELMADSILSCQAPVSVVVPTLKRIANEAWSLDNFDTIKLSRYMRCLFKFALPGANDVAEDILDQIKDAAGRAAETDLPYPREELEWIATTAFNRAIDFYCQGNDVPCKAWAQKAINIAGLVPDDGAMSSMLEEKLLNLSWDDA